MTTAFDTPTAGRGTVPTQRAQIWAEVPVEELVVRAQCGNAAAFGDIYDRYVSLVYQSLYARCRQQQLAEDLTQETFLRALRHIRSFDGRGSLAGWLCRIAHNAFVDHARRPASSELPTDVT